MDFASAVSLRTLHAATPIALPRYVEGRIADLGVLWTLLHVAVATVVNLHSHLNHKRGHRNACLQALRATCQQLLAGRV